MVTLAKELNNSGGDNRFKFQSFKDRIQNLSFNIHHKLVKTDFSSDIPEYQSLLKECLDKWRELNCTTHFAEFYAEIKPLTSSLAEILFKKSQIVEIILKHLRVPDSLALEPLLDILTVLSQDLDEDFYPFFPEFGSTIIQLTDSMDSSSIEWCFNSIAYLMKFLSKHIVKDILTVYSIFIPNLKNKKSHLRVFSAQALGFIIRKIKNESVLDDLFSFMFTNLNSEYSDRYCRGVSTVLYEVVKHVSGTLHSSSNHSIPVILQSFQKVYSVQDCSCDVLTHFCTLICHHINEDSYNHFSNLFIQLIPTYQSYPWFIEILVMLSVIKKGAMINDSQRKQLIQFCQDSIVQINEKSIDVTSGEFLDHQLQLSILQLGSALLYPASLEFSLVNGNSLLNLIFAFKNAQYTFYFCELLRKRRWTHFSGLILVNLLSFLEDSASVNLDSCIQYMHTIVLEEEFWPLVPAYLKCPKGLLRFKTDKFSKPFIDSFLSLTSNSIESILSDCEMSSRLVVHLQILRKISSKSTEIDNSIDSLLDAVISSTQIVKLDNHKQIIGELILTFVSRVKFYRDSSIIKVKINQILFNLLPAISSTQTGLNSILKCLEYCKSHSTLDSLFSSKTLASLLPLIQDCVGNKDVEIRKTALSIANLFEQEQLISNESSVFTGPIKLFDMFLELDTIVNQLDTIRSKVAVLKRIQNLLLSNTLPSKYKMLTCFFFIGNLSSAFSPFVAELYKIIPSFVGISPEIWDIYWKQLVHCRRMAYLMESSNEEVQFQVNSYNGLENNEMGLIYQDESILKFTKLASNPALEFNKTKSFTIQNQDIDNSKRSDYIYYLNLLKGLPSMKSLTDSHSMDISTLFLEIAHLYTKQDESPTKKRKLIRTETIEFIQLLSEIQRPRKIQKSQQILEINESFLSNGDAAIQKPALKFIIKYHDQFLASQSESLFNLIDDKKFRDALSTLQLENVSSKMKVEEFMVFIGVVSRILYGKIISKKERGSKSGLKQVRVAVFSFVSIWRECDLLVFVDLLHQSFNPCELSELITELEPSSSIESISISPKVQSGYLHVIKDFIKQLKSNCEPFLPRIFTTLFQISQHSSKFNITFDQDLEEEEDNIDQPTQKNIKKEFNSEILKCLKEIYLVPLTMSLDDYSSYIIAHLVAPKLKLFDRENSQSVSSLLDLIYCWSTNSKFIKYLFWNGTNILGPVVSVLSAKKLQSQVVKRVIEILENICIFAFEPIPPKSNSADDDVVMSEIDEYDLKTNILLPNINSIIINLKSIIQDSENETFKSSNGSFLTRSIRIISQLSSMVSEQSLAIEIMDILIPFLKKNPKTISELVKIDMMVIFESFLPYLTLKGDELFESTYYRTFSSLFSLLISNGAREQLGNTFKQFVKIEPTMDRTAQVLQNLNTFTLKKLDSRNYDSFFNAINEISTELINQLNHFTILPILNNLLYCVSDEAEYSVRTAAAHSIKLFISRAATSNDASLMTLLEYNVFPSIKKGLRFAPEPCRQEFMLILGDLVSKSPDHPLFKDMVPLLGTSTDDETNFFINVYHIQAHRRSRAIRKISESPTLFSISNISNIILPVLIHNIYESANSKDQQIVNDSLQAMGVFCEVLPWGQYYSVLKRFIYNVTKKPALEKIMIRSTVMIISRFHFDLKNQPMNDKAIEKIENGNEGAHDDDDDEEEPQVVVNQSSKIHNIVVQKIIPELEQHLSIKNDEIISIRVPVAESIALLLKNLPTQSMETQLPKLLLKLCNLLKSHLQDTRDTTREVLVKVQLILGPQYLHFILETLQHSLTKGYQLHVLGWTANSIISALLPTLKDQDIEITDPIDHSCPVIMKILIDDLFSEIGNERDVADLKGKMKEIKSTKSFLTCELLASCISINSIGTLILPIKEILLETRETKVLTKVDEVLRCFSSGLTKNPHISSDDLLQFIYGLLSESLPIYQVAQEDAFKKSYHKVQLGRPSIQDNVKYFQANVHKFLEFGLTILLQCLRHEKTDIRKIETLSKLDSLVTLLGRLLFSKHDTVVCISIRVLSILIKVELKSIQDVLPVIVKKAFNIIGSHRARESELMQVTFKFLISIIRDKKDYHVNEKQLTALLSLLKLDLEEPDRHTTSYSLIKAIVARKIINEELYNVMDSVSNVMVTSQSSQIRELSRYTYVQFLFDYPQGIKRLQNQINILLNNLNYTFESGRESVLETIHLCFLKFDIESISPFVEVFFVSLVMEMVNDSSKKCRDLCRILLKILLTDKCDQAMISRLFIVLNEWYSSEQIILQRVYIQVMGMSMVLLLLLSVVESGLLDKTNRNVLVDRINEICSKLLIEINESDGEKNGDDPHPFWQIGYFSLDTFEKLYFHDKNFVMNQIGTFKSLIKLLNYPHSSIKETIFRLFSNIVQSIDPKTLQIINTKTTFKLFEDHSIVSDLCITLVEQIQDVDIGLESSTHLSQTLLFLCSFIHNSNHEFISSFQKDPLTLYSIVKQLTNVSKKSSLFQKVHSNLIKHRVFTFFQLVIDEFEQKDFQKFSQIMVYVLYLASSDETNHVSDSLKTTCLQVMESLSKKISVPEYLKVYNNVTLQVQVSRNTRKEKKSILVVNNPEVSIKRKLVKSLKERGKKKVKIQEWKDGKIRQKNSSKASSVY